MVTLAIMAEWHNRSILQIWTLTPGKAAEIQQYMNCPPSGNESGLVGYWDFEEGTGMLVNDL